MPRNATCPQCSHKFVLLPHYTPLPEYKVTAVIRELKRAGSRGMTDDELDKALRWGHQTTSAVTTQMRYEKKIKWKRIKRKRVTRPTRKGCDAGVNEIVRA